MGESEIFLIGIFLMYFCPIGSLPKSIVVFMSFEMNIISGFMTGQITSK